MSTIEFLEVEGAVFCERKKSAETRDRTGDLQIFSLTLSQLSYRGRCKRQTLTLHVLVLMISTIRNKLEKNRDLQNNFFLLAAKHLKFAPPEK